MTAKLTPISERFAARFSENRIEEAMFNLAAGLAGELTGCEAPDDVAMALALREPVSAATILFDLAQDLGITPPAVVRLALGGDAV